MDTKIDHKFLIKLVEERPLLWDRSLLNFGNRKATKQAWIEVSKGLISNYESMDDTKKRAAAELILRKWTHIRDNYRKSLKKANRISNRKGSQNLKPYIHTERLKFLDKVINVSATPEDPVSDNEPIQDTSNIDAALIAKTEDIYQIDSDNEESDNSADWKDYTDNSESITSNLEEPAIEQHQPMEIIEYTNSSSLVVGTMNRHMAFFQSILPTLEYFDDNQILEFQMGVLQLLKNIRSTCNKQ